MSLDLPRQCRYSGAVLATAVPHDDGCGCEPCRAEVAKRLARLHAERLGLAAAEELAGRESVSIEQRPASAGVLHRWVAT